MSVSRGGVVTMIMITKLWLVFYLTGCCLGEETTGRFANLDRLVSRLGGSTQATEETEPSTRGPEGHLRRHWASWARRSHEDYDDDDDDDDDDDVHVDVDDSHDDNMLVEDHHQADTAHRRPFTTRVSWPMNNKWESSRKYTDNSWNRFRWEPSFVNTGDKPESTGENEVRDSLRLSRETICRVPLPKVVRVSEHYPSGSKFYYPSCTKLYQCAEDTGCCALSQKCGPKTTQRIDLYFYTTYLVSSEGRHNKMNSTIEKLPFYNHTECECQNRSDEMPRDIDNLYTTQLRTRKSGCRCPSEYTVRYLANGSCACDCFDKQRDCTKYKKGKEYFNHQDKLCIESGMCRVPACDFGAYMRRPGRCPRKQEKFRSWTRYRS